MNYFSNCPSDMIEHIVSFSQEYTQFILSRTSKQFKLKSDISIGSMALKVAEEQSLDLLQWFVQQGYVIDEETFAAAAKGNKFKTLKWLKSQGCP